MPTSFLTGRTRTLSFGGTFSGGSAAVPVEGVGTDGTPTGLLAYSHFWRTVIKVGYAGWTLQASAYVFDSSGDPWDFPRESSAFQSGFIELDILNPAGGTVQTISTEIINGGWHDPISFDFGTATWSASLPVRERCTIGDLAELDAAAVTAVDGTDFPSFAGSAQGDGPPASYCTFTEEATGNLVLTISAGGMSLTQTVSSSGLAWSYQVYRETFISNLNQAGTATVSGEMNGLPLVGSLSLSGIYELDPSGAQILNAPFNSDPSYHAYLLMSTTQVPVEYDLNARLRSFGDPFPGGGTILWLANSAGYQALAGPTATATSNQRAFTATAELDSVVQASNSASELSWVRVYATNPGDDARDWRCAIRGKPFDSFTLSQDASLSIYGGGTFTAPTVVTPTVTNWEGYRYLSFSADQAGSITIGTKTYDWPTPGSITLDLCSPSSWSVAALPAIDSRTGRWPLVNPSTSPTGTPDETTVSDATKGVYWGIFRASSLTITPATSLLNVSTMSLTRQHNAFATFLPKFLPDFYGWKDSAANTYDLAPFLTLESDGRQVCDWPAALHVLPLAGSPSFTFYTLSDLIGFINATPGWHAVSVASFPSDGYHNNSLSAFFAFGSGAVSSDGEWLEGVDVPISATPRTVKAQTLFDQVQGYPGIGNAWEASDYGGPPGLPINVTKHWRGAAWGLAFNTVGAPLAGVRILAQNPAPAGSGVADSAGEYKTGPPYGQGQLDTTTQLASGSPSDHKPWANRWRVRDSFRGTIPGERQPWNLVTPAGDYHRASISASGDIVYRSAPLTSVDWVVTLTLTSSGNWSWPRMVRDHLSRIELRAIQDGQGAFAFLSDDEGASWSSPTALLMSATLCDIRCSPDGTLLETCFVPDSGASGPGTFSMRIRRAGDPSWSAPFVPNDNAGAHLRSDGSGFAVDHALEGPDRWLLTMVADGQTAASDWWSADDGVTWKQF